MRGLARQENTVAPAGERAYTGGVEPVFDIWVAWIDEIPSTRPGCVLCGGREAAPVNTFLLNGRRFHTVRCLTDGMMWLDPRPTEAFYERLYREHYHRVAELRARGEEDPLLEQATLDVQSHDELLWRAAGWRLDELEALGAHPPGRLLEVGFGGGHTLAEAHRRGWDVYGLEASETCLSAGVAKGVPPDRVSDLPFLAFRPQNVDDLFDVVAAYSVIEHVPNPEAWLHHAHSLLRPGGLLVLRLPDTPDSGPCASLIARLHHFSRRTITALLTRCGFDVCYFGSASVWRPTRYPGELPNVNVAARRGVQDAAPGS